MSIVLYCSVVEHPDGGTPNLVIGTHDSEQNVPPEAYGLSQPVTMIPWETTATLERYGEVVEGRIDLRPWLAPILTTKEQLSAYAKHKRQFIAYHADSFDDVQRSFESLQSVLKGIDSGKLKTIEQIDKAWG
jgi:hypothetical protein